MRKYVLLIILALLIPVAAYSWMGVVVPGCGTVASGAGYISEVTLNESTPDAWDAYTGTEGSAGADSTLNDTSERTDIKGSTNYHWHILWWDPFGAGANQIDDGTTAAEINDATLTITFYSGRDGETGDTLWVDAINETFCWSGYTGDGVTFENRNAGSTECTQSIAATTSWTAGSNDLDDSFSGNSATADMDGVSTTATFDVTNMVKYWCNNPTLTGFAIHLSAQTGASDLEFFTFDGTTPPFIVVNDGL